jgi:hypothetical protein
MTNDEGMNEAPPVERRCVESFELPSTFDLQPSTFDLQPSTFDIRHFPPRQTLPAAPMSAA